MKLTLPASALTLSLLLGATAAFAWNSTGTVRCVDSGQPLSGVTVLLYSTDAGTPFSASTTTDNNGYFDIALPEAPQCFNLSLFMTDGGTVVTPASGSYDFCTSEASQVITSNFTANSPSCDPVVTETACWLTAGGGKVELGEKGPDDSWGGNVYPGCSSTAGEGGSWNHIAHALGLHFQGRAIHVLGCGNVAGIPSGSDSPKTPYNWIEFNGTGTLKGIGGNKVNYGTVYFFAHCEDRSEPGSKGQSDDAAKDRYFLNVYTDPTNPAGSSVLLEDVDGNPATMDPVAVTDGNMQIHISSCSAAPAPSAAALSRLSYPVTTGATAGQVWLAAPSPTPARTHTRLTFNLPRSADVSLAAYDVSGRQVRSMNSGRLAPGVHSFDWTLRNDYSQPLRAGVYFVRLVVDGKAYSRAVVIAR